MDVRIQIGRHDSVVACPVTHAGSSFSITFLFFPSKIFLKFEIKFKKIEFIFFTFDFSVVYGQFVGRGGNLAARESPANIQGDDGFLRPEYQSGRLRPQRNRHRRTG